VARKNPPWAGGGGCIPLIPPLDPPMMLSIV